MANELVEEVFAALEAARSDAALAGSTLRTPDVRALSGHYFGAIRREDKVEVFGACEALLTRRDDDARLIAFDWAFRLRRHFSESDFGRFERWLLDYVDGWGSCDDLCTHAYGALINQFPHLFSDLQKWTGSSNRWQRRAAAVVLIYAVRRQIMFDEAFAIADLLMDDEDDLVQKGYGWLLKEVSNYDPQAVFDYVMRNKENMPRTSLRYAVEKLDQTRRSQAMARQRGEI